MNADPFPIAGGERPHAGQAIEEEDTSLDITTRIGNLVASSPVFLFMKGTPEMPRCGFSANIVAILHSLGVSFKSFDILSDENIRQGVKEYSHWPTYPQLFVDKKLVGGNDVVSQLYEEGELTRVLGLSPS